jgi:hypothetical protein
VRVAESRFADSTHCAGIRRGFLGGLLRPAAVRNADGSGAPASDSRGRSLRARWPVALLTAFVFALALAPTAGAKLGVVSQFQFQSYFQSGGVAGSFRAPSGGAVNGLGTGGAEAGDVYGSDGGNNFGANKQIMQFDKEGRLKRLWGEDVVAEGPDNANQTQSVAIFATGGTFTLEFGAEVTGSIPHSASAALVESELNALASIGGVGGHVTVEGGPGSEDGSSPYLVSFGGVQGGANQPLLVVDDSNLTGPGTTFVQVTNQGGTGREICEPQNGDSCKEGTKQYYDVRVDQTTGDVYAVGGNGVDRFTGTGEFLGTSGYDVVKSGFDDSTVDAQQLVRVKCTGGTYVLRVSYEGAQRESSAIPCAATAAEVATAIDNMPVFGTAGGGSTTVTGGLNVTGEYIYKVTFKGVHTGDRVNNMNSLTGNLQGSGKFVTIAEIVAGGAAEVCKPRDVCQEGGTGGENGAVGGNFNTGIAVAPAGTPNEGDIIVTSNTRVQEFDPAGHFFRTFGGGVVAGGASGEGNLTEGSYDVTSAKTTSGKFSEGQVVTGSGIPPETTIVAVSPGKLTLSNPAIATGSGVTLTVAETSGNVPKNEVQTVTLANAPAAGSTFTLNFSRPAPDSDSATTAAIPYNATTGEVQEALEALSNIEPGDVAIGGSPESWSIEFTGRFADTDVEQLVADGAGLHAGPGKPLHCVDQEPNQPKEGVTYQWLANGASLGSANGAQTDTYTVQATDEGKAIQCETKGHASGGTTSTRNVSNPAVIPPAPSPTPPTLKNPENDINLRLVAPTPSNPTAGTVETCKAESFQGGWNGSPTSYTYQWYVNGDPVGSPLTIAATSSTREVQAADVPGAIQCSVTATNTGGSVKAFSVVTNTAEAPSPPVVGMFPQFSLPSAKAATETPGATSFEVCTASSGDVCTSPISSKELGSFGGSLRGVAEGPNGAIYTLEYSGFNSTQRVTKFTPSGGSLTPEFFGDDEVQKVTVNATGGDFRLAMVDPNGARGNGSCNSNSPVVTNLVVAAGTFHVGEPFTMEVNNNDPPRQPLKIKEVGPSSLTLTGEAGINANGCRFTSPEFVYTLDLPAAATAGEVEAAIDELAPIQADNGSVSVTGGPGGVSPFVVTFDGGQFPRTDQPQLAWEPGGTPLSGGSEDVSIETTTPGGPNGYQTPSVPGLNISGETAPLDLDISPSGDIVIAKNSPAGQVVCGNGHFAPREPSVMVLDQAGHTLEQSQGCTGLFPHDGSFVPAQRLTVNAQTGTPYLWESDNAPSMALFGDPGGQEELTVDTASSLAATGATISGTINPNGPNDPGLDLAPFPSNTIYRVEYREAGEEEWLPYAHDAEFGHQTSPAPFSVGLSGLTPKHEYEARVVVNKAGFEQVEASTPPFKTLAAPPAIDAFSSSNVTAESADLHASINARGSATTYHFEYGLTSAYGQETPETPLAGESFSPLKVQDHIDNLQPLVYHFRVVATNAAGTVTSGDQTFHFYPEPCPNTAARQQTGAGLLPDCRAYELVSPGEAGTVNLFAAGAPAPKASNPPRIMYAGNFGTLPGPWNPANFIFDSYVATRTSSGWETSYAGIPADVQGGVAGQPGVHNGGELNGGPVADQSLSHVLQWTLGPAGIFPIFYYVGTESWSPYVYGPQGQSLGRLPTNLAEVPGADLPIYRRDFESTPHEPTQEGWTGDQTISPDFGHYFFSTKDYVFAAGGLTANPGSVYDNDLKTGAVTVISKLPGGGDDIPAEPGIDHPLEIPATSTDGSHALIAAPAQCKTGGGEPSTGYQCANIFEFAPSVLYMRVDDAVTYSVSQGHVVSYQGMTEDGSKVFFTSAERLTADDHDNSIDLFMWSEKGEEEGHPLTRLSAGTGSIGDTDACAANWIAKCGVEVVPIVNDQLEQENEPTLSLSATTDNSVAEDSGDVYFYSPEQFVANQGAPGKRNLFVSRHGQIQYVATFADDNPATRIQVTPSGSHAAFITASQVTSYDNESPDGVCKRSPKGFPISGPRCRMMYVYNAETGELACASCDPSGDPPTSDVEGSLNGIFLSADGRAFFSTNQALVSADSNEDTDVYEYTDGRPQLISSGLAEKTRGYEVEGSNFFGRSEIQGLIGVSENGIDVYFATKDTLVSQDHNGGFMKIYDARTNGGFPAAAQVAPCAAADECHGQTSTPPAPPAITSGSNLGVNGNASHSSGHHKRKRHRKQRRHHRKHRRHAKRHGSAGK